MAGRDDTVKPHSEVDGKKGAKNVKVEARIGDPGDARVAFTSHQQYADLALAVTLQDLAKSGSTLDRNERPAFSQNPANVVRLYPEKSKERLITRVLEQYSKS